MQSVINKFSFPPSHKSSKAHSPTNSKQKAHSLQRFTILDASPVSCRGITALFSLLMFAALAALMTFNHAIDNTLIAILITHTLGLIIPLLLIRLQQLNAARYALLSVFTSYSCWFALYLGGASNFHFGLLICASASLLLFSSQERNHTLVLISILLVLFLTLEFAAVKPTVNDSALLIALLAKYNIITTIVALWLLTTIMMHNKLCIEGTLREELIKANSLLMNLLPTELAEKLMNNHAPVTQHFANTTILFADIESFTTLSQDYSDEQILGFLHEVFTCFDNICRAYDLEKIKTIGDEYMAVCGVSQPVVNHAKQTCLCSLALHTAFQNISHHHQINIGLRIGINSGDVIAGVIGSYKPHFDVWGNTVNLASRMEQHSSRNKIRVSQHTHELVAEDFSFESCDQINVKGIGSTKSYILQGLKTHDSTRY